MPQLTAFAPPTTADELVRLPDEVYGELDAGVFVRTTPHTAWQGMVSARIGRAVAATADAGGIGECFATGTAFRLTRDPDTVRCPDFAFVRGERLTQGLTWRAFEGAPDLAVEVLSADHTREAASRKTAEYLRCGARRVWIVDPEDRTVSVYAAGGLPRLLEGDDVLDGGDLLPGFTTPVSAFFAGLPPADVPGEPPA